MTVAGCDDALVPLGRLVESGDAEVPLADAAELGLAVLDLVVLGALDVEATALAGDPLVVLLSEPPQPESAIAIAHKATGPSTEFCISISRE